MEKLAELVARRLQETADDMVAEWVEWLRSRLDQPLVDSLPYQALLNHIPPVLRALTRYVQNPTFAVREEVVGHLRIHGQIRRDQGYEATDVMAEFDGLCHIIIRRLRAEVEAAEAPVPVSEALDVFSRLSDGLRAMSYVTLAMYHGTAEDRQQELSRRLADFGRSISHEMKNPLHNIQLSTDVLKHWLNDRDGDADSPVKDQIEIIRRSVRHADGLLNDVNVLAMAQGGGSRSRMVPLPRLLEDAMTELSAMARRHDVDVRIEGQLPRVAVEGTVGTLALVNVLSNAIKYSDPQKSERWVTVKAELEPEEADSPFVEVTTSDNGIGLAKSLQSRAFQRGFRAHPEHAEGTGLGLSLTQELITERGGVMTLESEEHEGTVVAFQLRAIDAHAVGSLWAKERPEELMGSAVRMITRIDASGRKEP